MTDEPTEATPTVPALTEDQHLAIVRAKAQEFLAAIGAASDAGISQAIIVPELFAIMRDSGIQLDPRALVGLG